MTQVMSSLGLFLLFALLPVLWATGEVLSPFGILPDLPLANPTAYLDPLAGRGDPSWWQNLMRPFV